MSFGYSRRISVLAVAFIVLCTGFPSEAQDAAKAKGEVASLRKKFQKKKAAASAPQLDRYARKLVDLEHEAARAGDYKLAVRIRDEREAALADWRRMTNSSEDSAAFASLAAKDATLAGGLKLERETGTITGWKARKAVATWSLPPGFGAGPYSVELDYASVGSSCEGNVTDGFYSLKRPLSATGSLSSYQQVKLKVMRIHAGAKTFSAAISGKSADGFVLRGVTLRKLSTPQLPK